MLKVAPLRNMLGAEGPQLFWLIPVSVLIAMATTSLLSLGPMTVTAALIALMIILMVRYNRIALYVFPLCLAAMISLIWLAADQHQRNIRYGIFGEVYYASTYYTEFAPWLNILHAGAPFDRGISASVGLAKPSSPSGHILIRSPRFERKTLRKGELSCDARCRTLLKYPAVKTVTIEVQTDIWNQGPRALMAFSNPAPRTFKIENTSECHSALAGEIAPLSIDGSGTTMQQAAFLGRKCMSSQPAKDEILFDVVLDDRAFIEF